MSYLTCYKRPPLLREDTLKYHNFIIYILYITIHFREITALFCEDYIKM